MEDVKLMVLFKFYFIGVIGKFSNGALFVVYMGRFSMYSVQVQYCISLEMSR